MESTTKKVRKLRPDGEIACSACGEVACVSLWTRGWPASYRGDACNYDATRARAAEPELDVRRIA